ncbi:MAG: hypothetical protein Q8908_14785, partial [Bacteroidota bacterium]|nr:hypothetical protein [Bacteroidota bacterium]
SLMPLDNLHGGSYFTDIIKLAKIIQSKDDIRPKGYRAIELSRTDPLLVTRLNFNKRNSLGSTLFNFPQITFSDDQKSVSLAIHDFNTRHDLHWPSSFWSFRFILAIAQLPDFVYDEEQNEYRPVIPDLELLTVAAFTQWLSAVTAPPEIKLEAAFAAPALQHPGTTVIVALGIEISSVPMAATGTLTPHQGTMGILNCFV